jgi:hypothetical protein
MNRREFLKKSLEGIVLGSITLILNCEKNPIKYEISTNELIQSYLDYSDIGVMWAYTSLQEGFDAVKRNCFELSELLKRKDVYIELLNYYNKMDPAAYDINWPSAKIGKYTFQFTYIEMVFAQETLLLGLSNNDIRELFLELLEKYQLKVDNLNKYAILGLRTTALPLGRTMRLKQYEYEMFESLLNTPGIKEYLDQVLSPPLPYIMDILNNIIETAVDFSGYRKI